MVSLTDLLAQNISKTAIPSTVMQVVQMLMNDDVDCKKLATLVKSDQALTMAVVRRANSAAFAGAQKKFNLEQSIIRLGTKNLMHLIFECKMMDILCKPNAAYGLDRLSSWRSAVGGAIAAGYIAKKHAPEVEDLCYICALLRDIGKTLLDMQYGEQYTFAKVNTSTLSLFTQYEQETYGYDHAMVGAQVAQSWKMPKVVQDCILFHHQPPMHEPEHNIVFDIVHAADVIALWSGVAVGHDGMQYTIAEHVIDELQISRPYVVDVISNMVIELDALETTLNLSME